MPTLYDENGEPVEIPDDVGDLRTKYEAELKANRDRENRIKKLEGELAPIKAAQRDASVAEAFTEAGFTAREAKLFARLNPEAEPTAEAIAAFATEYELEPKGEQPPAESQKQLAETQGAQAPAAPQAPVFSGPSQGGTPAGQGMMSKAEWKQLLATDRAAANRAVEQGRVQWNNPQAVAAVLASRGIDQR